MIKKTPDLRPLTARALTSVMETLRPYLTDSEVLDLYSGKGRFGISALEEGAKRVTFVEIDRRLVRDLTDGLQRYTERSEAHGMDALHFVEWAHQKERLYDIVFADPPFRLWTESYAKALLTAIKTVLSPGAIFLVRYPKRMLISVPNHGLTQWKTSVFGESELNYFRFGK